MFRQAEIDTAESLSLGQSLMREGYLSDAQYSRVLKLIRSGGGNEKASLASGTRSPVTRRQQEDDLLGKLGVREGWITAADLRQCLDREVTEFPARTLAEIDTRLKQPVANASGIRRVL